MTPAQVRIVPYRDEYVPDFDRLNREWLVRYDLLEPIDEAVLAAPRQRVIETGGQIFFAVSAEVVLGTCAALWHEPGVLEMCKLAVAPEARGQGLGRDLVLTVLGFARESGARRVILVSNTKLTAALRLYESLGFQHRPIPPDFGYATADVYMELDLDPGPGA